MKILSLAAIVFAMFAQGCATNCIGEYTYDIENVGEYELDLMIQVEKNIQAWTGHDISFIAAKGATTCNVEFFHSGEQIPFRDGLNPWGDAHPLTREIRLEIKHREEDVIVLSHEVLHTMGMSHVGNSSSIMYVMAKPKQYWTKEDQKECQLQGICEPIH